MACYQAAGKKCSKGTLPGTRALMTYILENFFVTNGGTFNCRPVNTPGGSSSLSVHAVGRAGDCMVKKRKDPEGTRLVNWLIAFSRELGKVIPGAAVQFIIWNRKKYPCSTDFQAAAYGGYNHEDHVHWELNVTAAKSLTYEKIQEIMGGEMTPEQAKKLIDLMASMEKLMHQVKNSLASIDKKTKAT